MQTRAECGTCGRIWSTRPNGPTLRACMVGTA
jgi:hypothetical protein